MKDDEKQGCDDAVDRMYWDINQAIQFLDKGQPEKSRALLTALILDQPIKKDMYHA